MSGNNDIPNRTFLISGAASGLGKAMAVALLSNGQRIAAFDLPSEADRTSDLRARAAALGASGNLLIVCGDVRNTIDCERAVAETLRHFGTLDGVVNNASLGMSAISADALSKGLPFYAVPAERWQAVIDTNLNGPFFLARAAMPHLLASGWGRIVNIITGYEGMTRRAFSPYGPSKAGVEAATVAWAGDLKDTQITVNSLLPGGAADTPMVNVEAVPDRSKLLSPEIMAPPIVWLLSSASDGISGYQFIAKDWNPSLPTEMNVRNAGAPAFALQRLAVEVQR